MEKEISQAVIRRMPRYYRYLGELLEEGVERISSNDLSHRMMVTASQIRQDLNNFGGFGQQGYGYNVKYLYDEIGKILGLNETHNIIMIGAGNLGQAITNYVKFERFGFIITALFDVKPSLKGQTVRDIPIYMMDELDDYCKKNKVDIAALTLPKEKAEDTAHDSTLPAENSEAHNVCGIQDGTIIDTASPIAINFFHFFIFVFLSLFTFYGIVVTIQYSIFFIFLLSYSITFEKSTDNKRLSKSGH